MFGSRMDASGILLAVIAALLIGGVAAVTLAMRADPAKDALSGDRIVNVLFVLERDGKPLISHALMYYGATRRAIAFDVPGELGLIIKSLGRVDRIDALYDPRDPKAYPEEVSGLLGADIPFCISFDIDSLVKMVDLLDGVPIFIADPVRSLDSDPVVLMPSGSVVLDGAKARTFATYSLPDEESAEAIDRRQRLMLALIKRLGEKNDFIESPQVRPLFSDLVGSNMDTRAFYRLLNEISGVDVERVVIQRVQGNSKEVSGQVLLFPYYDGSLIKDIVKQSLASLARTSEGGGSDRVYTVEVLNGTGSSGFARKTADLLEGFGYEILSIGNAERQDYERSEIIDRSGDDAAVKVFGDIIRCETIRREARSASEGPALDVGADFTIILGKDFNGRYIVR